MRRPALALLASLAVMSAPAYAAETAVPATAPLLSQKATALVDITTPLAMLQQQFVNNFVAGFDSALAGDARSALEEARRPGLQKAMRTALIAEVERAAPSEMERLRKTIAAMYEQTFTLEDMDATIAFFSGAPGQRMLERMRTSSQESIAQMRRDGPLDKQRGAALDKVVDNAAVAALQGMNAEDSAAFYAFSRTSAARKMDAVRPQLMALMNREMVVMSERLAAKIMPVIGQTITQYKPTK